VETLRLALGIIGREHRGRFILLVVISLGSAGLEVVGAALIYLLLSLITDPDRPIELPVVGSITDYVQVDQTTLLLGVVAALAVFLVVSSLFRIGDSYVRNRIIENMSARMSSRMLGGYLAMPYSFHLQRNSAELIRNSYQTVKDLAAGQISRFVGVAAQTTLLIGMLGLLVAVTPVAALLAVVVIGSAAAVVSLIIQPRLREFGRIAHDEKRRSLEALQQSLHGVRDVKLMGLERAFSTTYATSANRMARTNYVKSVYVTLPGIVIEVALLGFIILLFTLSILAGDAARNTLPVLGLFAYAGRRIQPAIGTIVSAINGLRTDDAPIRDVASDMKLMREQAESTKEAQPLPFNQELRLDGVRFRYATAHRDALTDVDLVIRPGEIIGVCGPTGGGKTTLMDIISGLVPPTEGRVTVDGEPIAQHARRWQRALGVVPQTIFLIDGTLRANIALGVPPEEIDEERVRDAVALAQLEAFVADLPAGLDTTVGERGVRVSGGQRQRIAIARALYRRPSVLMLDEGTSALDNLTEREIMGAISSLRGTHTIIMVAHRLTTVRDADRIVYVEDGRITAVGPYDELLATNDSFRRLAAV
jgi:ATP-binding cassette, subfamily B, bacterial PglK